MSGRWVSPSLRPRPADNARLRGQAAAIIQRHVTGCMRAMTEGLAPKTIANVHGLLSAAVAYYHKDPATTP